MTNLNPLKGFRDLYPTEKGVQNFIFQKIRDVANLFGYEEYDGPVVEPVEIYLNKTSKELLDRQTFQIKDKKGEILVLRPEMTPTLARMVANKAGSLTFPLRLFNLGVRFRYEAPQKGRSREFWQADFDILGTDSILADAENIYTAVSLLLTLGASSDDFVLYINSRKFIEGKLNDIGLKKEQIKKTLTLIDRVDKTGREFFSSSLKKLRLNSSVIEKIVDLIGKKIKPDENKYFEELFVILKSLGVEKYCQINTAVVRGLDYYTGVVFEAQEKGSLNRALLGGGRYDNLVSDFNSKANISGVGFALSDVILEEFLKDKKLLPTIKTKQTKILVTVFNEELVFDSLEILKTLRQENIPSEIYPGIDIKLDKQLKYADRKNIPYVAIIGPQEVKKGVVTIKTLKTKTQQSMAKNKLVSFFE